MRHHPDRFRSKPLHPIGNSPASQDKRDEAKAPKGIGDRELVLDVLQRMREAEQEAKRSHLGPE